MEGKSFAVKRAFNRTLAMMTSIFAAPPARVCTIQDMPGMEVKIDQLLQEAGRLHQGGDWVQARTHYLDILALSGDHPQALFLWSLVSFQLGDPGSAKHGLNQYLKQHGEDLTAWGLLGQCLHVLKEYASAVGIFKNLTYLEPQEVHHALQLAQAYRGWGIEHWEAAQETLNGLYRIHPHDERVLSGLSDFYLEQLRFELALPLMKELCAIDPSNPQYRLNLGVVHQGLKQSEEAQWNYAQALELNPAESSAHYNWGVLLQEDGDNLLAIDHYRQALSLKPDYFEVYGNLCVALGHTQSYSEAMALVREAIIKTPQSDELHFCQGLLFERMGHFQEANDSFSQAIALNPDNAKAHWNLGLNCLRLGEFEIGWAHHEWRWQMESFKPTALKTSKPAWLGPRSSPGNITAAQTLLVWAEQGLGDEVMFASLLPQVRQWVSRLLVQVDTRLLSLMKRSMPEIEFIPRGQAIDVQDDVCHISMGSLPQFCRGSLASFGEQPKGYLMADLDRVQVLREQLLASLPPELKANCWVGISWRSRSKASGLNRSLDLITLAQALDAPGVQLVNLQYGDVGEEIEQCFAQTGIRVHQVRSVNNFSDLEGLSALIKAVDAVVSVDNVTVHLAGALNQAVLALLPFEADWRWMLEASQSPWYPSVQLLRQKTLGDWTHTMQSLKQLFKPS